VPDSPIASPEPNLIAALNVTPEIASDSSGTPSPAPSLRHGVFLSGLMKSALQDNGSDQQRHGNIDIIKVYLDGDSDECHELSQQDMCEDLQEYYFVVYKVWVVVDGKQWYLS
jgi:hypothetical protein